MEKRAPDAFYNQFEVSEATQAAFHMLNANILLAHVGDNDQGRNFFHNLKQSPISIFHICLDPTMVASSVQCRPPTSVSGISRYLSFIWLIFHYWKELVLV